MGIRNELLQKIETVNGVSFIGDIVEVSNADALRKICFDLKNELASPYVVCLCVNIGGKPNVALMLSDDWMEAKNTDAPTLVKTHISDF